MPMVEYTTRDIKQGTVVDPAWYVVKVETVGEEPSKDKASTNYPVEITILKNADNGDEKFAGVPWKFYFNSKAIGMTIGFIKAFGVEPKEGQRIELKAAEGQLLEMAIDNKPYEGRIVNNNPGKYRPLQDKNKVA